MKKYPLISEITHEQKCHMAWRGDRYTGFGVFEIARMCRGEYGDMPIDEAFRKLDMSPHQSKVHAAAVCKYDPVTYKPVK